ncbi:MAG: hypothetical protein HC880_06580, partial [Bacteroidia bacterium]|nr:hypothetical protein [Bacteroidia bacterium]
CNPPTASLQVSGANDLCNSGTYTATLHPNTRYSWTTSSNISLQSGQGTAAVQVSGTGAGSGWVEVRFFNDCGTIRTVRRNINVSNPAQPGQIRDNAGNGGFFIFCQYQTIPSLFVDPTTGAAGYDWELRNGSNQVIDTRTNSTRFYTTPAGLGLGSYNLRVRSRNSCAVSAYTSANFVILSQSECNQGGFAVFAFPNPTDEEFNVLVEPINGAQAENLGAGDLASLYTQDKEQEELKEEINIQLLDDQGKEKKKVKTKKKRSKIPVKEIKPGTYYFKVTHSKGEKIVRVQIER